MFSKSLISDQALNNLSLIESLLFYRGHYYLKDAHLKRIQDTASLLDFDFPLKQVNNALNAISFQLKKHQKYKIRLLLGTNKQISLSFEEIQSPSSNNIAISPHKMHSNNPFLYIKSSERSHFEKSMNIIRENSLYDLIHLNEKEELTEGTYNNILIKKENHYFTPPVSCGLLSGTLRNYLLEKYSSIEEKILKLEDLREANEIFLLNSVRGIKKVELKELL